MARLELLTAAKLAFPRTADGSPVGGAPARLPRAVTGRTTAVTTATQGVRAVSGGDSRAERSTFSRGRDAPRDRSPTLPWAGTR
jgi:hypothetical protein